ncbi:MAG: hypothetical protein ABI192_00395 [Bradyrhizobium sp.]
MAEPKNDTLLKSDMGAVLSRTHLQTNLHGFLLPVFEAISNAMHGVEEAFADQVEAQSKGFAYTLADRGSWLSFDNKGSLVVAIEGDAKLLNRYDVIELNPRKHGPVRLADAKIFADWLVSSEGQQAIDAYQVNGERPFNASAASPR